MNSPDETKNTKEDVAYEILQYLVDNPNAQDTLEGIVTWWLLVRAVKHRIALVKEALAMLVEDGLVIAQQGSDSRTHYRINRQRRRKIMTLLEQRS